MFLWGRDGLVQLGDWVGVYVPGVVDGDGIKVLVELLSRLPRFAKLPSLGLPRRGNDIRFNLLGQGLPGVFRGGW